MPDKNNDGTHAELIAMIDNFIQEEKEKTNNPQESESEAQSFSLPGDYLVDTQSIEDTNQLSQKEQDKLNKKISGDLDRFLEVESRKQKNLANHPSRPSIQHQQHNNTHNSSCASSLQYSADVEDCDGYQSVDDSTTIHVMSTAPDAQSHGTNDGYTTDGCDSMTTDASQRPQISDIFKQSHDDKTAAPTDLAPTFDSSSNSSSDEDHPEDEAPQTYSPSRVKDIRRMFEAKPKAMDDEGKKSDDDGDNNNESGALSKLQGEGLAPPLTGVPDTSSDAVAQKLNTTANNDDKNKNNNTAPTTAGGMEGFYRLQRLRKFAEREKVKETWTKHHSRNKEPVRGLMRAPSAKAQVFENGKSSWDSSDVRNGQSVSETKTNFSNGNAPTSLVPYQTHDYRGFIFVIHKQHGLVLLHCTRKKNKPHHYQLPGGHVDKEEFSKAACQSQDRDTQLVSACKEGAARELFEETGIDVRSDMDRLEPAPLREKDTDEKLLKNEFKDRFFFFLHVSDSDFLPAAEKDGTTQAHGALVPNIRLKLSDEHSGFMFEPNAIRAAELLRLHSGGKCSNALLMAMSHDEGAPLTTPDHHKTPVKEEVAGSLLYPTAVEDTPLRAESATPEMASATTSSTTTTTLDHPLLGKPDIQEKGESMVLGPDECLETSDVDDPYREDGGQHVLDVFPQPEKKSLFCCFGF